MKQTTNHGKVANLILFSTLISSVVSFLGIVFDINVFKYLAAIFQVLVLVLSIRTIIRHTDTVNWKVALPVMFILCLYPLLRILIDNIESLNLKSITDGFIANGSYYQFPVSGLAIAIISQKKDLFKLFSKVAIVAFPIGILLMLLSMETVEDLKIGVGHLAIINCFIPAALLTLQNRRKSLMILGFISILLILFVSSRIWSRSYSLVGFYLAGFALLRQFRTGNRKLAFQILGLSLISYLLGAFSFFTSASEMRDESVAEKYQIESLLNSIDLFFTNGNIAALYYWEGNSRADILVDAFKDFTTSEWLLGRGLYGTYVSFVERHTIEIGWLQELFNWGLPYVVFAIYFFLSARRSLNRSTLPSSNPLMQMLSVLILIKFLDAWVFGMPQYSYYNFLVFWGVMSLCLKKMKFSNKELLTQQKRYVKVN